MPDPPFCVRLTLLSCIEEDTKHAWSTAACAMVWAHHVCNCRGCAVQQQSVRAQPFSWRCQERRSPILAAAKQQNAEQWGRQSKVLDQQRGHLWQHTVA